MKKKFEVFALSVLFLSLTTQLFGAAGYDFSALLNPANLENVDTVCRNSAGAQVFGISFDKISVISGKSAFGVNVPQKVLITNLRLDVFAQNLTQDELDKARFPRPLDFEIVGLSMTVFGKKNIMKIAASQARLFKKNILYFSDDATLSVGGKSVNLGKNATAELKGRTLIIRSKSAGNLAIKI